MSREGYQNGLYPLSEVVAGFCRDAGVSDPSKLTLEQLAGLASSITSERHWVHGTPQEGLTSEVVMSAKPDELVTHSIKVTAHGVAQ